MARPNFRFKPGFTLIELLVVMLIISVLIALLIPAVNSARQAARSTQSKNNLKQISLAANLFHSAKTYFPPSSEFPLEKPATGNDLAPWSIFALILPYLEQNTMYSDLDFTRNYSYVTATGSEVTTADGNAILLSAMRVPTYVSPAEPRDEARLGSNGLPQHYPLNYAVNLGTWLVYNPATGQGGNGSAYPGSRLRDGGFTDGLSSTLAFAEVKGWQPYIRNTGASDATLATALPNGNYDPTVTAASMVTTLGSLVGGGSAEVKSQSGHTEWVDGRSHHAGFTTVFRPNQKVLIGNAGATPTADGTVNAAGTGNLDCDWNNWQEGKGLNQSTPTTTPTYAAITARSYFKGIVNVAMMDGSVRSIDDKINLGVWRAISTRAGSERLPNDFNKN